MDIEKILTLIDKVSESSITAFSLEEGSFKVNIEKKPAKIVTSVPVVSEVAMPQIQSATQAPAVEPTVQAPVKEEVNENTVMITAPLVGVFYAAPNPDAKPYVQVGDVVKKGQIVGIIEAMKLMNEIESEVDGVIAEILVENGSAVEYGQPMFVVK